jgi:hypothetical protein
MFDKDGDRSIGYLGGERVVCSHPKLIGLRSHVAYRESSGHFNIEGEASILNECGIGLSAHWAICKLLIESILNALAL